VLAVSALRTAAPLGSWRAPYPIARSNDLDLGAGVGVDGALNVVPLLADADDDMVLDTAVNGQADILVTLNRRDVEPAAGTFALRLLSPGEAVRWLERTR